MQGISVQKFLLGLMAALVIADHYLMQLQRKF